MNKKDNLHIDFDNDALEEKQNLENKKSLLNLIRYLLYDDKEFFKSIDLYTDTLNQDLILKITISKDELLKESAKFYYIESFLNKLTLK